MPKPRKPKCYIATNLSADEKDAKYAFLDGECEMTGDIENADIIIFDLNHKPATWPLYLGFPARTGVAEVIFTATDDVDDEHLELIKLCFQETYDYDLEVIQPEALVNGIRRTLGFKRKVTQEMTQLVASLTVQSQKGAVE